jgi:uncharacterized cofD-like protein
MTEAIRQSSAPLVCVLNLMTVYGETQGYTASCHVAEIARYAGRLPDAVIAHRGQVPHNLALKYRAEAAEQVRVDPDQLYEMGVKVVKHQNVMSTASYVRHDPARIAQVLVQLFDELAPATKTRK